ncbi:YkgJ family cysteine cluster protein [Phragmitibacter flavus]|uniref:YkgJ family cysteine cluster protein n=1 Tax=Phragmitibacter flavus TaxID=2576071 RepID=A0A5R8K788_9BACT|nr:YkgJ family cysteine cluster protein [Phragmitibacter flavus]TLD68237.1 YkgJ family cysteine cluster protein [Phragmitibacter flavus]
MPPPPEFREEMTAIYAALEQRPIDHSCTARTQCCQFQLTGRTPMLTKGEALFAAIGVKASGRKKLPDRQDGACPLLGKSGKCMIYQHRPFGCRTHFCQAAGGAFPRKQVADLIQRLDALDEKLKGDGPRPIQGAIAAVLD